MLARVQALDEYKVDIFFLCVCCLNIKKSLPVTMVVQDGKLLEGKMGWTYSALTPPDTNHLRLGISSAAILSA